MVVGTLCKGKRKEVKVIDRNMFPGLILQREGTESENNIAVFYILQYSILKRKGERKYLGAPGMLEEASSCRHNHSCLATAGGGSAT